VGAGTSAAVRRILEREADRAGAPGAACGVLLDGVEHIAAAGVTSVEDPRPVGERTLFQVGSISKAFTALAAMQLVEAGRIGLEDRIVEHVPDLVAECALDERTTLAHLLSHQAGFDGDVLLVSRASSLSAIRGARRLFDPGEGFSYSNAAFSVAGAVVAALAGAPFDDVVRQRILKPLGMQRSCFTADRAIHESVALPHWVSPGRPPTVLRSGWQRGWELPATDWPPAGLASSVRDQLAWCRFNLGDGAAPDCTRLVSAAGLGRLHAPAARQDAANTVGLGWFQWSIDGVDALGHVGLTIGYCSELVLLPSHRFALVTLTNATSGAAVFRAVRRRVVGELLGLDDPDPVPLAPPPDPVALAAYEGTFDHSFGRIVMTAAGPDHPGELLARHLPRPEGEVRWQPPPPPTQRVALWAPDQLVVVHPPGFAGLTQSAGRAPDGSVSHLVWGGRRAPRAP
jgi:CubicO group peptidase (beta-lactamase class C family)